MLFSIPFLIITFFVYALIPELRNLNGKNLMCYVSALTISFILLAVVKLGAGCELKLYFDLNIMNYCIF